METLWAETSAHLYAFLRARVEDDPTAEDLLQEVFVRIHQNMASLRSRERLESWMYTIARNALIDYYRARRSLAELPDTLLDPVGSRHEPDAAEELAASVRALVDGLPEPYREAIRLTEFEGLSQVEMAARLGISLSGAKSRVQRARQKMKAALLSCCHFEFDRYGRVIDYWERCCCCAAPNSDNPC